MFLNRDTTFVTLVSVVGIVLTISASYVATKRIRDWQAEFATAGEAPTYMASSLFLEHHRLLDAITGFVRADPDISRDDLYDRIDIYWSRYDVMLSNIHIFDAAPIAKSVEGLPPDSHSEILIDSLNKIQAGFEPALNRVEQGIEVLNPADYEAYLSIRHVLDILSDPLSKLQIASFERKLYLNGVQVELSEHLRSSLRNAFIGIGSGVILLSYLIMLYLRQRRRATEELEDINNQLRENIKESERLGKELSFRARHDDLSGLVNRFGFSEDLSNLLATKQGLHGLCFLDLDLFKVVNDTCGHAAGDEVLKDIARMLRHRLPDNSSLARFGGDEFVLLLRDCKQTEFVEFINSCCEDLTAYIFTYAGQRFDVTGSFGAIHFEASEFDGHTLLAIADAACYEAKNAGGARVHFHHGDDDLVETRQYDLQWVGRIQNALEEQKFQLFRQPIMALKSHDLKTPDHWEVLIRMIGQDGELILPGQFFEVAERYSLSPRIDRWVMEQTFYWLNTVYETQNRSEYININLSGMSIGDSDFLRRIEQLTLNLKIPTSNVCFEITETAAMRKHARTFLTRLKQLGYRLALDDFGIGFSSFGYLESLPVDYIKIDGLFVRDLQHNLAHREFVKSINDIGKVMGKQTVAEFVESAESLAILKEIGVDFVQGYYLASPIPLIAPAELATIGRKTPEQNIGVSVQ